MPHFNPSGSALIARAGVEKQHQPPRAAAPGCDWREVWEMRLKAGTARHGTARPVLQHSPVTHGTSHTLPAGTVEINLPKLFAEETCREPPQPVRRAAGHRPLGRSVPAARSAQGRLRTPPWGPGAWEMRMCPCYKQPENVQRVWICIRTRGGKC